MGKMKLKMKQSPSTCRVVYGKDNVFERFHSLISHNIRSMLRVVSLYDAMDDAAL
jgi:hypothetical protein